MTRLTSACISFFLSLSPFLPRVIVRNKGSSSNEAISKYLVPFVTKIFLDTVERLILLKSIYFLIHWIDFIDFKSYVSWNCK